MNKRPEYGQALIEGASSLVVIAIACGLAMLVMFNAAISGYYKDKLALISTQCAQYAANQSGSLQDTQQYATSLMQATHFGSGSPKVTVNSTQIAGENGYTVTVSDSFPLFGQIFGPRVALSDSSCALAPVLGNSELVLRYNTSVSAKLTEVVVIPGIVIQLPPPPAAPGIPRYTLNGDAGWMPLPEYGLSKP